MKNTPQRYLALIGDLINSKKIKNRKEVQVELINVFDRIQQKYGAHIVSKFTLTVGDEFQAVLVPHACVWKLIDHLSILSPSPFRLGLGLGGIITQIDPNISLGADGEAYWRARDAIQTVHKDNWGGKSHILFKGYNNQHDKAINSLILAGETIKASWSQVQRETFEKLVSFDIYEPDFVQTEAADHLGITPQALSKRLITGNIKIYFQLREVLGQLLEDYDDRTE